MPSVMSAKGDEMMQQINKVQELSRGTLEGIVLGSDLSRLTPSQKIEYITGLCQRLGLDPATQPLKIMRLNGREIAYADRGCASQLNRLHGISHQITHQERVDDVFIVSDRATDAGGRFTEEMGVVAIGGLKGEALANALMKARTKAMRRATLTHVGLGLLDEEEVKTIPNAVQIEMGRPGDCNPPPEVAIVEDSAKPKEGAEWLPGDIAAAKDAVHAYCDELAEHGLTEEDIKKTVKSVMAKIGDPESTYDQWANRFCTWADKNDAKIGKVRK